MNASSIVAHRDSMATTQLCQSRLKAAVDINKWSWLYSNTTLFTKKQAESQIMTWGSWFADPCSRLLQHYESFFNTDFLFEYNFTFKTCYCLGSLPICSCFGVLFQILFPPLCIKYCVLFVPLKVFKFWILCLSFQLTWNLFFCDMSYESNLNCHFMTELS